MATATITFTTDDSDPNTLDVRIDFNPDFQNSDEGTNPLCHHAAFIAVEAVTEALALGPAET